MKRSIITLGLLIAAAFALTNCAQKESYAPVQEEAGEIVSFQFAANLPAETKTFHNGGLVTEWSAGDEVKLAYVFTAPLTGNQYTGVFSNPFTTTGYGTEGDGVFTGKVDLVKDGLSAAGALTGVLKLSATYPYKASGEVTVPQLTVQNGYDNKEHLAGENCPLYGNVTIDLKNQTLSDLLQGKITIPRIQMQHCSSIIEVNVKNGSDAPVVIESVGFRVGQSFKGFTNVENAKELPVGETALVYIVTEPFNVPAGSEKIEFWVNNTATEFEVKDKDVTFSPGKIKKVAISYDEVETELYAVADVTVEQTVERIVPSVNTLLDCNYLKQWAENLKAQENIEDVLTDAIYAFAAMDLDEAYEILGGIPGFERQVETVPGSARFIKKVDHELTDYITSFIESLKQVNSVHSLLEWIQGVENVYKYTGIKAEFLNALGNLEQYEDNLNAYLDNLGNDVISKLLKSAIKSAWDRVKSFSVTEFLTDVVDEYWAKPLVDIADSILFRGSAISESLLNSFKDILVKIDQQWHPIESPDQSDIDVAKGQALFQALVGAGAASDANLSKLNAEEISKLEKSIWGIFLCIMEKEETKAVFVDLKLESVYTKLEQIADFLVNTVTYKNISDAYPVTYQHCEAPLTPSELAVYLAE